MRTATLFTAGWLAPVAFASVIPPLEGTSPALSFDKRQDTTFNVLNGKILQADIYAGIAGLNQQIYQATQKPDQWKKCNPLNIVVRREWYNIIRVISMKICH